MTLTVVTLGGAYAAVPARWVSRARTCLPRSMAACGVWSGCRGQVAPDVKINRAVAAEWAASGLWRSALVCAARCRPLPPESQATRSTTR